LNTFCVNCESYVRQFLAVIQEHSWSCCSLRRKRTGHCQFCFPSLWTYASLPTTWVSVIHSVLLVLIIQFFWKYCMYSCISWKI